MTHAHGRVSSHEVSLIQAFILPHRRKRFLSLLENPRARRKLLGYFYHLQDLDPRFAHWIVPSEQTADKIYRLLTKKGAPDTCHVMGNSDLDGQDVDLRVALKVIVDIDGAWGTFLSCIPGKLGHFGGEYHNDQYILER